MIRRQGIARRRFLLGCAASGAAMFMPRARVLGANERVNVGVVGLGGKGNGHLRNLLNNRNAQVVALCDVDQQRLTKSARDANKGKVALYRDYRELLTNDAIDAVVLATPNHWHALGAILACRAGKHVYVEKPVSHSIWEGRKMVEAAQHYDRIVQTGSQELSDPAILAACDIIGEGQLGAVEWVHGLWNDNRTSIGNVRGPQNVPDTIAYDLWCGPRPVEPPRRRRLHYDWHWFWDYGNGDIGNQVAHNVEIVHKVMAMGEAIPHRVMSVGNRFKWNDDGQTPNSMFLWLEGSDRVPIIFVCQDLHMVHPQRGPVPSAKPAYERFGRSYRKINLFKCERGLVAVHAGGGDVLDNDGQRIRKLSGDGGRSHLPNFIDAVRARNRSKLNGPIDHGHHATTMVHLGNINHRIGRPVMPDQITERVRGSVEPAETWRQMRVHLERHKIDLTRERAVLGPWLTYDHANERFTGDLADSANPFIREEYREPFVIPDTV